jgi:hypothetical protein
LYNQVEENETTKVYTSTEAINYAW